MENRESKPCGTLVRLVVLLSLAISGCRGLEDLFDSNDLIAAAGVPRVLVEERPIHPPGSMRGNRFVSGWRPWREGEREGLLALESGGQLQFVQLSERGRALVLDLGESNAERGGEVLVRVAGREVGRLELREHLEISLPADLPVGRVMIELLPQDGALLFLRAASLRSALPQGEASVGEREVAQSGWSSVDFVLPLEPDCILRGFLRPPKTWRGHQELSIHVETRDRSEERFAWGSGPWARIRGRTKFEIPLPHSDELVRISLRSRGEGPSGTWEQLQISCRDDKLGDRVHPSSIPTGGEGASSPPKLVVLYVLDALRADRVGRIDGALETTPTIDRLAEEGWTFLGHRSVAPNTLPSTKALMTGIAPRRNGGAVLPRDGGVMTLAEHFRDMGYSTGLFSNNPYVGEAYGIDRGFDFVADQSSGQEGAFHDDASRLHSEALRWLRSLPDRRSTFVYLHTLHPHNPYSPPPPFDEIFTGGIESRIAGSTRTLLSIQRGRLATNEADRARLAALYDGNLAFNDAAFSDFLAELTSIYDPGEIFLAISSDHGEELFDHGGVLHGYTLYEEMLRIPLILWSPGRVGVGRTDLPTNTLDLHATLLELSGHPDTASDGESLLGTDRNLRPDRRKGLQLASAASLKGGVFSVQSDRWKYVWAPRTQRHWGMGEALGRSYDAEYLFDLEADPGETENRIGRFGLEEAWLRSRLLGWIRAGANPEESDSEIDPEIRKRLEALGYLE